MDHELDIFGGSFLDDDFFFDEMEEDEEVGILGMLAGLASSILPGLMGGGAAAPAPAAAPAAGGGGGGGRGGADIGAIVSALKPAIEAAGIPPASPLRNVSGEQLRTVVKELLVTVPPPVRAQVREAVRELQGTGLRTSAKLSKMAQEIDSKFKPQLQATMAALQVAKEQREATSEHRGILRNEERWRKSAGAQREQSKRLDQVLARVEAMGAHLEERLGGKLVIVRGDRTIDILGGANALRSAVR